MAGTVLVQPQELSHHDAMIKQFVDTDESHTWFHPKFRPCPSRKFSLRGFVEFVDDEGDHPFTIIPDAWALSFHTHTVSLLEVVHSHAIDEYKLGQIRNLFWILDGIEFGLELIIHDITLGVTLTVTPQQLADWAIMGAHGAPWKWLAEVSPAEPQPAV